jgi:hypothetical protein
VDPVRAGFFFCRPPTLPEFARFVMREDADFEMSVRLRQRGVSLGELFSFISGLYFRGKLAYARTFCFGTFFGAEKKQERGLCLEHRTT